MNECVLGDEDAKYLRRAIGLSAQARTRGNRPFGAVIVAADGRVEGTVGDMYMTFTVRQAA